MTLRPVRPVLIAMALHVSCAAAGLAIFLLASVAPVRLAGLAASTFGFVGLGALGHGASHEALTPWRTLDRMVLYLFYPVLLGLSASYWCHSHLAVHHRSPNVRGVDADTDLRPFFALNEDHLRDNGGLRARHPLVQVLLLLAFLPLNGFLIQLQAGAHLVRCVGDRQRRKRTPSLAIDLACLGAHYLLWILIPALFFPIEQVVGLYALRVAVIGIALFGVLAPGHYPHEALCIAPELYAKLPHVVRQTVTTSNFQTGVLGRLVCSGLDKQIEHHLFPSVSHVLLPHVAPIVREYLEQYGIPYHELGWGEAIAKSFGVFMRPKPVIVDLDALAVAFSRQRAAAMSGRAVARRPARSGRVGRHDTVEVAE